MNVKIILACIFLFVPFALFSEELYLPQVLNELVKEYDCDPYYNLYDHIGSYDPPFVFGVLKDGHEFMSAAVICNNPIGDSDGNLESEYRILIWRNHYQPPNSGCSLIIKGKFIPGGLRLAKKIPPLSKFQYLVEPEKTVREIGIVSGPIIETTSEDGHSYLYCHNGSWVVKNQFDQ